MIRFTSRGGWLAGVLVVALAAAGLMGLRPSPASAASANRNRDQIKLPEGMKSYPSPYYTIYTDLPADQVKEITIRMTKMAEEYHERTAGFSGTIRQQLPFYVFSKPEDYYAAGGIPGSAGVFMSRGSPNAADSDSRLMAIAIDFVMSEKKKAAAEESEEPTPKSKSAKGKGKVSKGSDENRDNKKSNDEGSFTWHVVQHEGFHQFAHAVIGGDLPMWVNEGLAEYFGESIFTGDSFVTGIIPPGRLGRLKAKIQSHQLKPIKQMMTITNAQWNAELNVDNYDMAWSMVHFLAHGEDGKYQKAFSAFMNDISRRKPWQTAWEANFGSADGFEKRWSDWWLGLNEDPTADTYARATLSTYTSFLGRAVAQKQGFDNFDEFLRQAKAHSVKISPNDWLPPGLLDMAERAQKRDDTQWSMETDATKTPHIVATLKDKTRVVGNFTLGGSRVSRVTVEIDDLVPVMERAKNLAAANMKEPARTLLRGAIGRHPKSPSIEAARRMMTELR